MESDSGKTRDQLAAELAKLNARLIELEASNEVLRARARELERKEKVFHATLDAVTDGVLAVDEQGKVIFSNKQFARMWRIPPDLIEAGDDNELLQFVLDQLVEPGEFLSKVKELYRSLHESCDFLHFRDGRVFQRDSLPLVIDQRLSGRVWCFRDITERERTATGV